MMRLQSKKIGIMLKIKQLGDTRILNEINRIMFEGAEVLIILLGEEKDGFPAFIRKLTPIRKITDNYGQDLKPLGKFCPAREGSLFDLLVFIPCTGKQLSLLAEMIPRDRDHNGLPLVIAPVLEKDTPPPFGDISALMDIRGIYFVPFGPLTRKGSGEKQAPALFYRLDLLTESCIAALEGHSLKHSFWENNFFPG
ncbi:MAG: hypothetical protein GXZ07_01895 [Firmicutes bacterium]|nr:hypothetical protein [Bacillota bacterium]